MITYPGNYKQVLAAFRLKPAPRGLIADLTWEWGDLGPYYLIVLYRDNFDSLPESTRVASTEWVLEALRHINLIAPAEPRIEERPPEGT